MCSDQAIFSTSFPWNQTVDFCHGDERLLGIGVSNSMAMSRKMSGCIAALAHTTVCTQ